ncbi:MAG TPA: type II toxin-antitoxin system VapC family toxin [Conexibacter sp.]|nr:type II toxin-antitoxin system VapC family toxin [Conexibacter sp.]
MVLDTSALVAILRKEPERETFAKLLANARDPLISAATLFECSMVQAKFDEGWVDLDDLIQATGIRVAAVDVTQAHAAREAWSRYGKGNGRAHLNFGDCFSYALATTTARPLLFKGDDFAQTDVTPATS